MVGAAAKTSDNIPFGIAIIVLTVFAMSSADAMIKYTSATFTLWQIYILRSLIVLPLLAVVALFGSQLSSAAGPAVGWALLRGFILAFMHVAIYAAIPVLSLATIAASLYTAPLFIAILSPLLVGEQVGPKRWAAVSLGFLGVLTILRPGTEAFSSLALIPVAAALLYAFAAIITRSKCASAPTMLLALALNLSLLIVGSMATIAVMVWRPMSASSYPFLFGPWAAMRVQDYGMIAVLAILMVGISLGLAKAYQVAPSSIIATFDYSYLPFSVFWSYVLFAEEPDAQTLLGMAMIAAAGFVVVWTPKAAKPPPRTVHRRGEMV